MSRRAGLVVPAFVLLPALVVWCFGPTRAAKAVQADEEGPTLHVTMEAMNGAFRAVARDAEDMTQRDDNLASLDELQRLILHARSLDPAVIEDAPADQRASMREEYRRTFILLLRATLDLEEALWDEDAEAAERAVQAIGGVIQQGHNTFYPN